MTRNYRVEKNGEGNGVALVRNTDPHTSHKAAEGVEGERARILRRKILRALQNHGPLTTPEIARYIGALRDSVTPRMVSLEKDSLVERVPDPDGKLDRNGKPKAATRTLPGHRACTLWRVL